MSERADGSEKPKPKGRAKPKAKAKVKKRPPGGLAAFTEGGAVPVRVTLARVGMILGYAAAMPVVLGVEDGRRLFWAAAIAALPLFWVLGGYHLWRRICPLAVFSQLGRLFGRPGTRRVGGWLAEGYPLLQVGLMITALSLRLIMTNGTPWALAGFVGVATLAAVAVGLVYTGKTWCNYVCPIGVVEKIYTEPSRLFGPRDSKCSPCTACKKHCPDIDLEQGYWKEIMLPARRGAYFAWPGIVFGFYAYFYLFAGNWGYYFSGAWTLESRQIERWLGPGLSFFHALPVIVAAPLTLLVLGAASFGVFTIVERVTLRALDGEKEARQLARHRSLVLAGFVAFIVFYFYGGQPTVRLLPTWFGRLLSVAVVVSGSAIFFRRWRRRESEFVEERFAEKILKRWEWGDDPPADRLQDIVVIHTERTKERKARLAAYKDAVREMVADGIVTRSEMALLDRLRAKLGITDKEHKKALAELDEEERQLFDPDYQGSVEQRMQREAHIRDLERVVISAARAGSRPDPEALEAVRREHGVSEEVQAEAMSELFADDGPVAALYREQLEEIAKLGAAHASAQSEQGSASLEYLRYVCRWRARRRIDLALDLLAPLVGVTVGERIRAGLISESAEARGRGRDSLAELVGEGRAEELARCLEGFSGPGGRELLAEPLLSLCADSSAYVRAAAVHVVSRFDDERSKEVVLQAIEDPEALVREAAFHALGVRGRIRRDLMARAVSDPDPRVRTAAVNAVAGRKSGRESVVDTEAAMAAAEVAESRGVVATLDPKAHIETLTSLEKMMLLRRVPMLAALEPDDLEEVGLLAEERRFAPEQTLCVEGQEGDEVFLIVSGTVEAWTGGDGERRILGRSGPGACIGEMAVLDAALRAATVTAIELTRTLVLSADDFHALLLSRPAIGESIIGVLLGRLRGLIASGAAARPAR